MSEAAAPLTAHEVVLADKHRTGPQDRELVLDVPSEAAVQALLESDLYQFHTRYASHVSVAVLAPAGHLSVSLYPHDGQTELSVDDFFRSPESDDSSPRGGSEKAGLLVESACTAERGDAVLDRVVAAIDPTSDDPKT